MSFRFQCFIALFVLTFISTLAIAQEQSAPPATAEDVQKLFRDQLPTSVEDLKKMEEVVTKLLPKLMASTISVQVGASQGSGVIIDKEGHVLTAAHVVGEPNKDAIFIMPDGKRYKGKTLGANHDIDAGLMKITDKVDLPAVEWGSSDVLKNGQWVLSIGHPGGYQKGRNPVVRLGRVLNARKTLIATDCTIMPGDSGGPLFDIEGKVVGIHSRIGGPLTANIHVPIEAYRGESWDRMVKAESWGREAATGPYLGVVGDQDVRDKAKLSQVNPGTPADKAGLKGGDVVLKFNDTEIKSFDQLSELVRKQKVGTTVTLKVERGDEKLDIKVKLAARPAG
jgi:serine protease Do